MHGRRTLGSEIEGVEAVVFDAVGTLIDPCPAVAEVYAGAAARQGVEVDVGDVRRRFREHFRRDELDDLRGPMVTDEAIEHRRWRRIVGGVLPGLPDPDRAFGELWEHFGRPEAWRCFDDVGPALAALTASGLRVCVGSNFDGRLREVLRGLPELAGLVETVIVSSEVGYRKPHPAFYRAVCERLGSPGERVLSVGDDPENDDVGARRAGLRAALVDRLGRRPDRPVVLPGLGPLAGLLPG